MDQISIIQPDDWHCHLRDGDFLNRTVHDTAAQFHRAIVMPNLQQPITSVSAAKNYRERILQHVPNNHDFNPLMTLYLTETMTTATIDDAKASGIIQGCKLYPAGATTLSDAGVVNLETIYPLFEAMQANDLVLMIHGESIDPAADIFDREALFVEKQLRPLLQHFPKLRVVLEHISTKFAAEFVKNGPDNLAATITAHHLLLNRNHLLVGGIRPHYYCLPILKKHNDQQALIQAATSGSAKFFLGTDSAPHVQTRKESSCGCAGIYTAHAAIELYAEVFAANNALANFEKFASINGPNFYQLPINQQKITLVKKSWQVADTLQFGSETLVPFFAGDTINWTIKK